MLDKSKKSKCELAQGAALLSLQSKIYDTVKDKTSDAKHKRVLWSPAQAVKNRSGGWQNKFSYFLLESAYLTEAVVIQPSGF